MREKAPTRDRKIIIVDGPDGCGKTNIAQGLSLDLGIPYFKVKTEHENWRKGKFKEALQFDQTYISQFLKQVKVDVIIDRAYPAEWVYSQVFGRETDMECLDRVDAAFADLGAIILIPLRHDYSANRDDELVDKERLPSLHQKYLEFRRWTRCETVTIYVDSYGNELKSEIEAIRPKLRWGARFGITDVFNITLDERRELKMSAPPPTRIADLRPPEHFVDLLDKERRR